MMNNQVIIYLKPLVLLLRHSQISLNQVIYCRAHQDRNVLSKDYQSLQLKRKIQKREKFHSQEVL